MYEISTFISYAHEDLIAAETLQDHFRSGGLAVYRDADGFRKGDDWTEKAKRLIEVSSNFVLLWSRASAVSSAVYQEIMVALSLQKHIISILVDDTPVFPLLRDNIFVSASDFLNLDKVAEKLLADFALSRVERGSTVGVRLVSGLAAFRKATKASFGMLRPLLSGKIEDIDQAYISLGVIEGLEPSRRETADSTKTLLDALHSDSCAVILAGHPGTGKTSTLHYLAHSAAESHDNSLVVYARLNDYDPQRHAALRDFTQHAIQRVLENAVVSELLSSEEAFTQLRVTLLLDGLDELSQDRYPLFVTAIKEFRGRFPDVRMLVSTRIDGFRDIREMDFPAWRKRTIAVLDQDRVEAFIRGWFKGAPDIGESLLRDLESPRFFELTGRAFLLALICLVYEKNRSIGRNRAELYQKAVEYLELKRCSLHPHKEIEIGRRAIKEIALRALQMGIEDVPEELATALGMHAAQRTVNLLEIKRLLDDLAVETGLIQFHGDSYCFTHRSLLEFYVASRLKEDPRGAEVLLENCHGSHWEEPIRLFAASLENRNDQESFVEALWSRNPALALRTATECGRVAPEFLGWLIQNSEASSRIRMLSEVRQSLGTLDSEVARHITIETVSPLFSVEKNSGVIYMGIELLRQFDPHDSGNVMRKFFIEPAAELRKLLAKTPEAKFDFVGLPEGWFRMGNDSTLANKEERPVHDVFISKFKIGRFAVTNSAFELIMGLEQGRRDEGISDGDADPVTQVNWYDAFVCALRVGCRLPTEAEWEYMARAGSETEWCYGNDEAELGKYANYHGHGPGRTWPVGSGLPNKWGIFDVHGNVWEWCSDWFAAYTPERQTNPSGPQGGSAKVRRGGGHAYHAIGCRTSFRWGNDPMYKFKDIGFRLAAPAE